MKFINFFNYVYNIKYKHFYSISIKIFKKEKEKRENVLNEVVSVNFNKNNLKLDKHKQFEGSETSLLLLESGLSETIQNNL